jgi:hypothetical protein
MDEFPNMPFNGYSFSWRQSYPASNLNRAPSNCEMAVIVAVDSLVSAGVTTCAATRLLNSLAQGDKY